METNFSASKVGDTYPDTGLECNARSRVQPVALSGTGLKDLIMSTSTGTRHFVTKSGG